LVPKEEGTLQLYLDLKEKRRTEKTCLGPAASGKKREKAVEDLPRRGMGGLVRKWRGKRKEGRRPHPDNPVIWGRGSKIF